MKILLIFPPVATPISPYLSTPLLAGQLQNAGYNADIIDLSVEFFEYILNTDLLMTSYSLAKIQLNELSEVVGNRTKDDINFKNYSDDIKKAILKKDLIENFIQQDNDNIEVINNINKYVQNYKDPKIFYDLPVMEAIAQKINKAFMIAMLPYYPLQCQFNVYKNYFYKLNYFAIKRQAYDEEENKILYEFYKNKIEQYNIDKYDLVCISCPNLTQILPSFILAKILKQTSSAKIVIGGNIISRIDKELKKAKDAFDIFYDYLMIGCGENSIVKLADYISGKNVKLTHIKGLIYKKEGRVYSNIADLKYNINESAMMSLKGLRLEKYFTPDIIMPIQSSKGCYWGKCLFCGLHYPPKKYTVKKPSKVADEMEFLNKNYNIRIFEFVDEALHPKYLSKLADEILKRNLDIKYVCCARLENKIYNPQLCAKLYKSGLRLIEFGFESASKRIYMQLNKGIKFENRLEVVKQIAQAGIWTYLYAIIGYPFETKEEALETLSLKQKNDNIVDTLFIHNFWLDKKAPAFKKLKHLKIKNIEDINLNSFTQSCPFTPEKKLPDEDIKELNDINYKQNPLSKYYTLCPDEYFFLYAIHFGRNKLRTMLQNLDTNQ